MSNLDIFDLEFEIMLVAVILVLVIVLLVVLIEKMTAGEDGSGCFSKAIQFGMIMFAVYLFSETCTEKLESNPGGNLGITLAPITADNAYRLAINEGVGWEIRGVESNSPAAKADIRAGDFLLHDGKTWFYSSTDLADPLYHVTAGKRSGDVLFLHGSRISNGYRYSLRYAVVLP